MSQITDDLVRNITRQIVERFRPKRIIAFGSYARGDHGPNNDLDLIVEMETDRPFYQRSVDIASIFGLRDWSMDLLVYTPEEYSEQRKKWGSLISLIEPEAKVLYDSSRQ